MVTDLGKTKASMKKDSKILKKIIDLTKDGTMKWDVFMLHSDIITYRSVYHITKSKYLDISYYYHKGRQSQDYMVFVYVDNKNNYKTEIKDVSPVNKFSPFNQWRLKSMFSKLYKDIEQKKDDKEHILDKFLSSHDDRPIIKITEPEKMFIFNKLVSLDTRKFNNKVISVNDMNSSFVIVYANNKASFVNSYDYMINNYSRSNYLDTSDYKIKPVYRLKEYFK